MATQTITSDVNVDAIAAGAWHSNDTLVINNGAVVTVDTDQSKFWNAITINNGKLRVTNASTDTPIRFTMGRTSGSAAPTCTPASGLGSIEIEGAFIDVGIGNGEANQSFTLPYTDHVAALWVETFAGSNDYELWLNTTATFGPYFGDPFLNELKGMGKGKKGHGFRQGVSPFCDRNLVVTGASVVSGSFVVTVADTSEILPGAAVLGSAGIPANVVVETITSATTFTLSIAATATTSTTLTFYNPVNWQLTNTAYFGDGVHGAVVPVGAKVRVPNIMITGAIANNLFGGSTGINGICFALGNGAPMTSKRCLFGFSVSNSFPQASSLVFEDVGFSYAQDFSETYDCTFRRVGFASGPAYYGLAETFGLLPSRWARYGVGFGYVKGVFEDISYFTQAGHTSSTQTDALGLLRFHYSSGLTVSGIKAQCARLSGGFAALGVAFVEGSTFSGIETYSNNVARIYSSSGNTFENWDYDLIQYAEYACPALAYNSRICLGIDPSTGLPFEDGVTYYAKIRGFGTYRDRDTQCIDSAVIAFVPHVSEPGGFFEVGITQGANSVSFTWQQVTPVHSAPAYEIFRSTEEGCPVRDATTRVFTTNSATTLNYTDSGLTNGTSYWYVIRKHSYAGVYCDTPAMEAIPNAAVLWKNLCLQSYVMSSTSWVKANVTVPPASLADPVSAFGRPADATRCVAYPTAANGTLTQAVSGLVVGWRYTMSVWLSFLGHCAAGVEQQRTTPVRITFGTAYLDCTVTKEPQRFSVTFTATATSHNAIIRLDTIQRRVLIGNVSVCAGATPQPDLYFATAAVSVSWQLGQTLIRSRRRGDNPKGRGVSFGPPSATTGVMYWELHIGRTKDFIPTAETAVAATNMVGAPIDITVASNNNTFRNLQHNGKAGTGRFQALTISAASRGNFIDGMEIHQGYTGIPTASSPIITISASSGDTKIKGLKVFDNIAYSSYNPLITADNSVVGLTLEDIWATNADAPIQLFSLDTVIKGMTGADTGATAGASNTPTLGNPYDSVPTSFAAVYGAQFAEFWHTDTLGALNIFFTSSAENPPYTLTGTAKFSNTGALYLQQPGDSITLTWPHKIYGVSGFRDAPHLCSTTDLGGYTVSSGQMLGAVLLEFQVDTGSGWTAWAEALSYDLSLVPVSATEGFNLRLRLTARQFLSFSTLVSPFTVGETIRQQTSGATARVTAVYYSGANGVLALDSVVGSFAPTTSLDILRDSDGAILAQGASLTNGAILGPSPVSYIRGLQIPVSVVPSVRYPSNPITLTFTGLLPGTDVVVREAGTETVLYSVEDIGGPSAVYTYYTAGALVDVDFYRPGYMPHTNIRGYLLGDTAASLPISQTPDSSYLE